MSKPQDWKKGPLRIMAEVDRQMNVGWDTDSTFTILERFIMENCDAKKFEKHVREIADQDLENSELSDIPIMPVFKKGMTDLMP